MSSSNGILLSCLPHFDSFITVGNGSTILVSYHGTSTLSTANTTFHLNNVLIAPALVRNLLSVRQFTCDNSCSIEFDAATTHAPLNLTLWVFLLRTYRQDA
jgi:hypothetical protein